MNKKKLVFVTSATGLILCFGAWKANSVKLSSLKTEVVNNSVEESAFQLTATNHMTFASVEELASRADLIVVGKTTKEFEQNKLVYVSVADKSKKRLQTNQSIIVYDETKSLLNYYTITQFEVKKILKGSAASKEIPVLQAGVMVPQSGKKAKYILASEDFSPLKANSSYILFLAKIDTVTFPNLAGAYSVISINQGKFNLDKTDDREQTIEIKDQQYKDLKAKILDKYKNIVIIRRLKNPTEVGENKYKI